MLHNQIHLNFYYHGVVYELKLVSDLQFVTYRLTNG